MFFLKNNSKADPEEEEEVDEEEALKQQHQQKRSRTQVDDGLRVYEIGSQDVSSEDLHIKKFHTNLSAQ